MKKILITGSSGLVGTTLKTCLKNAGWEIMGIDIAANGDGDDRQADIRNLAQIRGFMSGCSGVIHLAGVSRVIWGETDPSTCIDTNVNGLRNIIEAAEQQPQSPWVVFASSREVYGHPESCPVAEDDGLKPINVYGHTKAVGENMLMEARSRGLQTSIVRLSNVYGSSHDHVDRVVPAFVRGAIGNRQLRIDGKENTFDFTHVDDVARGLVKIAQKLNSGEKSLPTIHFVTGNPTTLEELAEQIKRLSGSNAPVQYAAPRSFDVSYFYGNPDRALSLLDWRPRVSLEDGLSSLIEELGVLLDT